MWFKWVLIALFLLDAMTTASKVGKKREPVSADLAAWSVLVNALFIAGIFFYWQ